MGTVKSDILDGLSLSTQNGVVTRAQRKFIVTDMPGIEDLQIFLEVLSSVGIPCAGQALTGFPDLIVTEVNPTVIDKDKCEVIVVYGNKYTEAQYFKTSNYAAIGGDISEPFVGEMDSNIQMVDTNEYVDDSNTKTPIKVSCTYSATNKAVNGVTYAGKTIDQVGTIQIPSVQKTWRGSGIIILDSVTAANELVKKMDGKSNYIAWLGGEPHQWLCTAVKYKLAGSVQSLYTGAFLPNLFAFYLTLEFQFNANTDHNNLPTGWNPEVVFIDDRTNKPPIKEDGTTELENGVGIKKIEYFGPAPKTTACDFKPLLGECI